MKLQCDKEKVLGTGGQGMVLHGFWGSTPVAVKRIQLFHVECKEEEEQALRNLKHPNVIKMFHAENDADFRYCNGSFNEKKIKFLIGWDNSSDILLSNCVKPRWISCS